MISRAISSLDALLKVTLSSLTLMFDTDANQLISTEKQITQKANIRCKWQSWYSYYVTHVNLFEIIIKLLITLHEDERLVIRSYAFGSHRESANQTTLN